MDLLSKQKDKNEWVSAFHGVCPGVFKRGHLRVIFFMSVLGLGQTAA